MGIFRGGLLILVSIMLFISILLGNIFLITSLSLDYETIQPKLIGITTNMANNEANLNQLLNINYHQILDDCKNQTEIYLTNYSINYNYKVPCETATKGSTEIANYTIEKIIEKAYYKDYDCKFTECIRESPLYIISETNKNKLKSNFNKALILSLILVAAIFVLVEKKRNTLIVTGIVIFLASLPLTKIDYPIKIFSKFMGIIPFTKTINDQLTELIILMFSYTQTIFNFNVALASMLIVLGIGLGLLHFLKHKGEKKFTKSEVEQIVDKRLNDNFIKEKFSKFIGNKKSKKKKE